MRPSTYGRLQVRAVAELFRNGLVSNVLLAGGNVWGEEYPSLSEVIKEELQRKFKIPENNIHLSDKAKDTTYQVDLFLEKAREMGWGNLIAIASRTHLPRIQRIFKNRGAQIKTISTEKILSAVSPDYSRFTAKFFRSSKRLGRIFYETVANLIMIVDRDGSYLRRKAEQQRTKRSKDVTV